MLIETNEKVRVNQSVLASRSQYETYSAKLAKLRVIPFWRRYIALQPPIDSYIKRTRFCLHHFLITVDLGNFVFTQGHRASITLTQPKVDACKPWCVVQVMTASDAHTLEPGTNCIDIACSAQTRRVDTEEDQPRVCR